MTQTASREAGDRPAIDIHQLAETLWKSADARRGQVDAAEYKHVVLGLLFLRYISDSFESRREELKAELEKDGIRGEQLERLLESRDEHTAERVFWVPLKPPFGVSNWSGQLLRGDKRWAFCDPPTGYANYAWIQHFIHHLAYPDGRGAGHGLDGWVYRGRTRGERAAEYRSTE